MVYNMLYYIKSISIVVNMSVTTPSPGSSDSSSNFELPWEYLHLDPKKFYYIYHHLWRVTAVT